MSAMEQPQQIRAMRACARQAAFEERWATLHRRAQQVGQLAALASEPLDGPLATIPARIAEAGEARFEIALDALEDIDAMLLPGLAALGALSARGRDPTAPALALWREFYNARQAILALCPLPQEDEAAA